MSKMPRVQGGYMVVVGGQHGEGGGQGLRFFFIAALGPHQGTEGAVEIYI